MIATIELKRRIVSTRILSIVIHEFQYRQESCPIILLSIDKNMQMNFHHAVLSLGWAICLRIKSDEKLLLNAKKVT